jgi:hypothetical protein
MATYKHLRSTTANKRPTTAIADGQIAINSNTASPGLFFKDSAGTGIVKVGPVHVGTTAPNSSPAGSSGNYLGEQWLDTSVTPSQLKVWNGSAWIGVVADELPVSKLENGSARQLIQTDAAGTGVEWASNIDIPGTLDVTSTATFDSVARYPAGTAAAPAITFTGDTNTGIFSPGADTLAFAEGGVEAMRIDSSGRVGIGTSSPSTRLDLLVSPGSGATDGLKVSDGTRNCFLHITGSAYSYNGAGASENLLYGSGNPLTLLADGQPLKFCAGSGERARIDTSGRLGLGTSSPGALLDVATNDGSSTATVRISNTSTAATANASTAALDFYSGDLSSPAGASVRAKIDIFANGNGGASDLRFLTNNSSGGIDERLRIDSSGRVGIGTTSPAQALHVLQSGGNNFAGITTQNSNSGTGIAGLEFSSDATYAKAAVGLIRNDANGVGSLVFYNASSTGAANWSTADERLRIDSSGRLLVGTSSSRQSNGGLQVESTAGNSFAFLTRNVNTSSGVELNLQKSRGATNGSFVVVAAEDEIGRVNFNGADGTADICAARITAAVDGTPGADDMPGRIVLSTTLDGASSPTERFRITNDGVIAHDQPAPAAVNATATLTVANLKAGIITSTSAAATDMTLPTGTDTQAGFSSTYDNFTFEWSVINTGPSLVRVLAGTAHTVVGSGSVATGTSGRFASRRTAANTFVSYRLS